MLVPCGVHVERQKNAGRLELAVWKKKKKNLMDPTAQGWLKIFLWYYWYTKDTHTTILILYGSFYVIELLNQKHLEIKWKNPNTSDNWVTGNPGYWGVAFRMKMRLAQRLRSVMPDNSTHCHCPCSLLCLACCLVLVSFAVTEAEYSMVLVPLHRCWCQNLMASKSDGFADAKMGKSYFTHYLQN